MTSTNVYDKQIEKLFSYGYADSLHRLCFHPLFTAICDTLILFHEDLTALFSCEELIDIVAQCPSEMVLYDIKALIDLGFNKEHINTLMEIGPKDALLRPCFNYTSMLLYFKGFTPGIHQHIVDAFKYNRYFLRIILQQEFSTVPPSIEHFQYSYFLHPYLPLVPNPGKYYTQKLIVLQYNRTQITALMKHAKKEELLPTSAQTIPVLIELHNGLINDFNHQELTYIAIEKGVGILHALNEYYRHLSSFGFSKEQLWKVIYLSNNPLKFKVLAEYITQLLHIGFTIPILIEIILKEKSEIIIELIGKYHLILSKDLAFKVNNLSAFATHKKGHEQLTTLLLRYVSLLNSGFTPQNISQASYNGGRKSMEMLLEHHSKLAQLGFRPQDILPLVMNYSGTANIAAILKYYNNPQSIYLSVDDLVKIVGHKTGYKTLELVIKYYEALKKIDFSHEDIITLANADNSSIKIEFAAIAGAILKKIHVKPCDIVLILKEFYGKENLKSLIQNYSLLRSQGFSEKQLLFIVKHNYAVPCIAELKEYYEHRDKYKFSFSPKELFFILVTSDGIKIFKAMKKHQDLLLAWEFTSEEVTILLAKNTVIKYLNEIAQYHDVLQELGFNKKHLFTLAQIGKTTYLINAIQSAKRFKNKGLLVSAILDQIILIIKNNPKKLADFFDETIIKERMNQKRKASDLERQYERKERWVGIIEKFFPDNAEEAILFMAQAEELLAEISPKDYLFRSLKIERVNENFCKLMLNRTLYEKDKNTFNSNIYEQHGTSFLSSFFINNDRNIFFQSPLPPQSLPDPTTLSVQEPTRMEFT